MDEVYAVEAVEEPVDESAALRQVAQGLTWATLVLGVAQGIHAGALYWLRLVIDQSGPNSLSPDFLDHLGLALIASSGLAAIAIIIGASGCLAGRNLRLAVVIGALILVLRRVIEGALTFQAALQVMQDESSWVAVQAFEAIGGLIIPLLFIWLFWPGRSEDWLAPLFQNRSRG